MTEYLEREGVEMPKGRSAKFRCQPSYEKEARRVKKELDECWNRLAKGMSRRRVGKGEAGEAVASWMKKEGVKILEENSRSERMEEVWRKWEVQCPEALGIEELEGRRERLGGFVICPVDKYPEEGQILCAKPYHDEALMRLAEGMKEPTKETVEEVLANIATLANGMRHLAFCELRPNGAHEFGA